MNISETAIPSFLLCGLCVLRVFTAEFKIMATNLDRFKKDLDALIEKGNQLHHAMQLECHPDEFTAALKKEIGKDTAL